MQWIELLRKEGSLEVGSFVASWIWRSVLAATRK